MPFSIDNGAEINPWLKNEAMADLFNSTLKPWIDLKAERSEAKINDFFSL